MVEREIGAKSSSFYQFIALHFIWDYAFTCWGVAHFPYSKFANWAKGPKGRYVAAQNGVQGYPVIETIKTQPCDLIVHISTNPAF